LAKENFPTVGPVLKKSFHHSLKTLLCPTLLQKIFPKLVVTRDKYFSEPRIARISRRSCSCHKC